jgi:hypothetical protein
MPLRAGRHLALTSLLVAGVTAAVSGCGGGDRPSTPTASIQGQAQNEAAQSFVLTGQGFLPPSLGGGAVAAASVSVIDLSLTGAPAFTVGTADAAGNYRVRLNLVGSAAILLSVTDSRGKAVVISGLTRPQQIGTFKNFDGATTIACFSGVGAVTTGQLTSLTLDARRIANLEQCAQRFVDTVDFTNVTGSVIPAADQCNSLTNFGLNPA